MQTETINRLKEALEPYGCQYDHNVIDLLNLLLANLCCTECELELRKLCIDILLASTAEDKGQAVTTFIDSLS